MNIIDTMKRLKDEVHESAELLISNNPLGVEFHIRVYLERVHNRAHTISYEAIERAKFDIVAEEIDQMIRIMAHEVNVGRTLNQQSWPL